LLCVQLVWMHHGVNAIFHSTRFPRFGVLFIGLIRTPGRPPTRSGPLHVDRENRSAKFWLDPDVALAANHGYSRRELRESECIMREDLETLRNA
jgi:hypothetical protein